MSPAVLRWPRTLPAYAWLGLLLVATVGATFLWTSDLRPYVVRTGSMEPALHPGDVVLARSTGRSPGIGDVVTFDLGPAGLVTHRVVEVDGRSLRTKGDANRTADPWTVLPAQVAGTMVHAIPDLGYAMVYLRQPAGAASLVAGTLAVVLAWQVFFGSTPPQPRPRGTRWRPGWRPRHGRRAADVAGVMLIVLAAGTASGSAARPTGAYFADSRSGTFALSWTCPDRHDDLPGNGSGTGHGHDRCHGSGHAKDLEDLR